MSVRPLMMSRALDQRVYLENLLIDGASLLLQSVIRSGLWWLVSDMSIFHLLQY